MDNFDSTIQSIDKMQNILLSLLFVAGDEGLQFSTIKDVLDVDQHIVQELISSFNSEVFQIHHYGDQILLTLTNEYSPYIKELIISKEKKLSQQALETLAIIAYNQPVTRNDIENLRQVNSDGAVNTLYALGLIDKLEVEGERSQQLITTEFFLNKFGLKSIADLPTMNDAKEREELEMFFNELEGTDSNES
ncbi:SMC-Scp complex subunit ScpB [Abyssicoccus albus]|uniref:SMC-Scp complex subunit ScpB n=1 Tax=Abyssicoccus albus TaxID=1817405 RepID=UPI001CEF97F3|nr:SMC-Scp complex subunit ScpB [Abyssicoccus albus]